MRIKNTYIFTLVSFVILNTSLKGQENNETPLDTLTRTVVNLADDVNKLKRLKISGYVQPQYQYIDSAGAPSFAGGDFANGSSKYFSRFMMRRGRFKFTYAYENVEMVVNIDATEKGLNMRETFAKITDPWKNMFSLTMGLLQVQFGYEVTQSSSVRETPERARYNQILFPVERDLGAFGSIVFPKSSSLYGLKMDVAVMNGVGGVAPEFDSNKDFTGRLQYSKTTPNEKITYAVGTSGYYGGYRIGSQKDYKFTKLANGDNGFDFAPDTANYNRLAQRIYMGADAQASFDWFPGITTLRGEYIMGENPGTASSNKSPSNLPTSAIYHRQFNGAYFYFIQDIGKSKFQVVAKYDWFDPNVKIAGNDIGKAGTKTSLGDIRFDTYGFGVTYRVNTHVKLVLYYDIVKNEGTQVAGYTGDIKDNVFTCRMQFRY
ncbi:MAG: porin [Bacteroidetes bacterium]|nr:porin [Bacteroidota bacterium]